MVSRLAATAGCSIVDPALVGHDELDAAEIKRAHGRVRLAAQRHVDQHAILDRVRQRADRVERARKRKHALLVDPPLAGLEPDDAAEACGRADRTAGVAADRARRKAAGNRDRGARRGSSGDARRRGITRISRRAEMRIEPKRGEGEFREIGFAEPHHSRRGQIGDDRRVFLFGRSVGIERRACGRALARHVDEVLPGDGNAIERPGRASLAMTFAARFRFLKRALAGDEDERWIVAVALDAIQTEFRDFNRIEAAFCDATPDPRSDCFSKLSVMLREASVPGEPTARARSAKLPTRMSRTQ